MNAIRRIEALILVCWVGLHLSAGYVVAPVLFKNLPRLTAGDIAGQLFHIVSYVGLVAIVLLLCASFFQSPVLSQKKRSVARLCLLASAVLIGINEWVITPVIVALKTHTEHGLATLLSSNFGVWHGVSSVIYLLVSCFALLFVWLWAANTPSS